MKALSKRAQKTFEKLIAGLEKSGDHRKIDNTNGAFMAVHVDRLAVTPFGPCFSVEHNFTQRGDLMSDPRMDFLKGSDGRVYPLSFQKDSTGTYQRPVTILEDGRVSVAARQQRDITTFAGQWMQNIKQQQGL